jgi:hypothetical protein
MAHRASGEIQMTRKSIRSFLVAGFAAASLMAFSAPVYAGTAQQSPAQAEQGWCEIVPTFCSNRCDKVSARCNPCQPNVQGVRNRGDKSGSPCPARNRE